MFADVANIERQRLAAEQSLVDVVREQVERERAFLDRKYGKPSSYLQSTALRSRQSVATETTCDETPRPSILARAHPTAAGSSDGARPSILAAYGVARAATNPAPPHRCQLCGGSHSQHQTEQFTSLPRFAVCHCDELDSRRQSVVFPERHIFTAPTVLSNINETLSAVDIVREQRRLAKLRHPAPSEWPLRDETSQVLRREVDAAAKREVTTQLAMLDLPATARIEERLAALAAKVDCAFSAGRRATAEVPTPQALPYPTHLSRTPPASSRQVGEHYQSEFRNVELTDAAELQSVATSLRETVAAMADLQRAAAATAAAASAAAASPPPAHPSTDANEAAIESVVRRIMSEQRTLRAETPAPTATRSAENPEPQRVIVVVKEEALQTEEFPTTMCYSTTDVGCGTDPAPPSEPGPVPTNASIISVDPAPLPNPPRPHEAIDAGTAILTHLQEKDQIISEQRKMLAWMQEQQARLQLQQQLQQQPPFQPAPTAQPPSQNAVNISVEEPREFRPTPSARPSRSPTPEVAVAHAQQQPRATRAVGAPRLQPPIRDVSATARRRSPSHTSHVAAAAHRANSGSYSHRFEQQRQRAAAEKRASDLARPTSSSFARSSHRFQVSYVQTHAHEGHLHACRHCEDGTCDELGLH